MVTVIDNDVVICLTEYLICFVDGLVPLLCSILTVIQYHIFKGCPKCEFPRVHGPPSHKIEYGAIGCADAGVANAGETTGDTRQSSPHETVRVAIMSRVDLHIHFELGLHFILFHLLYSPY